MAHRPQTKQRGRGLRATALGAPAAGPTSLSRLEGERLGLLALCARLGGPAQSTQLLPVGAF